jgi:hypothetical protein
VIALDRIMICVVKASCLLGWGCLQVDPCKLFPPGHRSRKQQQYQFDQLPDQSERLLQEQGGLSLCVQLPHKARCSQFPQSVRIPLQHIEPCTLMAFQYSHQSCKCRPIFPLQL